MKCFFLFVCACAVASQQDSSCSEARQCVLLLNSAAGPTGPAVCLEGKCRCRYDYEHANGTCILKKGILWARTPGSPAGTDWGSCE